MTCSYPPLKPSVIHRFLRFEFLRNQWPCQPDAISCFRFRSFRSPLDRIAILGRPCRFLPHGMLRLDGPIRFPQQFPPDKDEVRLAARDDFIRVLRIGNQAHAAGPDSRFLADAPGKRDLVAPWRPESSRRASFRRRRRRSDPRQAPSAPWQRTTDCSMSQPPSTQSVAEIRTNKGSSCGMIPRSRPATRSR